MKNKISILALSGALIISTFAFAGVAFAQTTPPGNSAWGRMQGQSRSPGVYGTVSAVSGNTITVNSKGFGQNPTATTYTVDATNATVKKAGVASSVANIAVGDTVMVAGTVSGTSVTTTTIRDGVVAGGFGDRGMMMGRGVYGTVVSNDGSSTLTVTSIARPGSTSTVGTTYTVTVTSTTKYTKNGAGTTLGNIAVGDTVMVGGKVSGTTITATTVSDGVVAPKTGAGINTASTFKGNGQPIIGGNVTAINGNSLTVTNTSNVTYTVDVTNATVTKSGAASNVSSITVGDDVVIQGAVNGSSVTASSVMDSGANATPNTSGGQGGHGGGLGGFFGGIGGFFKHLFGF
jgi:hypothetical protein